MPKARDLNPKQKLFVQEYLVDLNATAACLRAGYCEKNKKNADKVGPELLGNPRVKAQIDEAMRERGERTKCTADQVLIRLDRISDFDPVEAYDEKGFLKNFKDIPEHVRKCNKSIKVFEEWDGVGRDRTKIGESVEVTWIDRLKATELLGRHHKLFTDKIEFEGNAKLAEKMAKARARVGKK
jgi:phage terminase small subunit